ncbi:hypothetical protein ES703_60602 [subsurface metagenome]
MVERKRVRSIQLRVDDVVFKKLEELKGDRTWEEFLVEAGLNYVKAEEEV